MASVNSCVTCPRVIVLTLLSVSNAVLSYWFVEWKFTTIEFLKSFVLPDFQNGTFLFSPNLQKREFILQYSTKESVDNSNRKLYIHFKVIQHFRESNSSGPIWNIFQVNMHWQQICIEKCCVLLRSTKRSWKQIHYKYVFNFWNLFLNNSLKYVS